MGATAVADVTKDRNNGGGAPREQLARRAGETTAKLSPRTGEKNFRL
jgi:hypothetical protein